MGRPKARGLYWLPFGVVVLAQMVMVANISAIETAMGPIVKDYPTTTTYVQSALVACGLVTAAMMFLSVRLGTNHGSLPMFRGGVLLLGVAMLGVALSRGPAILILSEAAAGAAAAVLTPTRTTLVAANYAGRDRAVAIGAMTVTGGALALLLAGVVGTLLGWRVPFGILAGVTPLILLASWRLEPTPKQTGANIDWIGVVLSAGGLVALTVAINAIGSWGLVIASDAAPFDLFGLSPCMVLILLGIALLWVFFRHERRQERKGGTPLLSAEVAEAPGARRATLTLLVSAAVTGGSWYLLPLYMQIIQGYDGLLTALGMLPYALSVSCAALLVARFLGRFSIAPIARVAMVLMMCGLLLLGVVITNDWAKIVAILGLVILGLGQGALLNVVSNALIGATRSALAGEAGALRGTTSNIGSALGTAIAGTLLITLLASHIGSQVSASSALPPDLKNRLELVHVEFIGDQQLESEAKKAGLTQSEVEEVVRINTQARLTALRQALFALAALAAFGAIIAGGLRTPENLIARKAGPPRG